jgi:hypothetical protein
VLKDQGAQRFTSPVRSLAGEDEQVSMAAMFFPALRILSSTPSPHSCEYAFPGEVYQGTTGLRYVSESDK